MSDLRRRALRTGVRAAAAFLILVTMSAPGRSGEDEPEGFLQARPGYRFRFPRDHASHPGYKTEWWYYTGHLRAATGERFGFQLTFFRSALRPPPGREGGEAPRRRSRWAVRDLYFAHFAVSDRGRKTFFFDERMSRGSLGAAGAETERYRVWVGDWRAEAMERRKGAAHRLRARSGRYEIDLEVRPAKPPVIHGLDGTSRKGGGESQASHYYSLTRMAARGRLRILGDGGDGGGGKPRELAVTGSAWMDHEFGSSQLGRDQVGWDWFGLQLDDGSEVMLYLMRRKDGTADPFSSGTWIDQDGTASHLDRKSFRVEVLKRWKSGKSGATYPIRWRVRVPSRGATFLVEPVFPGQELDTRKSTNVTYWEGSVELKGEVKGKRVTGAGYVEMTGYAGPFKKKI